MTRQGGLGRGLGALIPGAEPGASGLITVALGDIVPNPRQPREAFDEDALEELAHSLREFGLLQPIVVRPLDDGRYGLVAGERRYRAAKLAGFDDLPAIVRNTGDELLLSEALVENIHRTELNPLEEAAAYHQLLDDFGMTHDALAQRLGKSRSAISNSLRLLSLPTSLQHHVTAGRLSAGHARAIVALSDTGQQQRVGEKVVEEGLSVRATEELVRRLLEGSQDDDGSKGNGSQPPPSPYAGLERRLEDALATKVRITGSARRGRVVIDYAGQEDLERLLAVLARGSGQNLLQEERP